MPKGVEHVGMEGIKVFEYDWFFLRCRKALSTRIIRIKILPQKNWFFLRCRKALSTIWARRRERSVFWFFLRCRKALSTERPVTGERLPVLIFSKMPKGVEHMNTSRKWNLTENNLIFSKMPKGVEHILISKLGEHRKSGWFFLRCRKALSTSLWKCCSIWRKADFF